MCAIAGAYTEFVPIVHIVGYPTEAAQHGKNIMHHSLGEVGDGKFEWVEPRFSCFRTGADIFGVFSMRCQNILPALRLSSMTRRWQQVRLTEF
jgi:hypothetical protein